MMLGKSASHSLASIALFRDLYDNKRDIYQIIAEYVIDVVTSERLYSFNLTGISHTLNESYGFHLPEAVIKTAINRIENVIVKDGTYTIPPDIRHKEIDNFDIKLRDMVSSHDVIISALVQYIASINDIDCNAIDRQVVLESFYSYLLGENAITEYYDMISAFIIQSNKDCTFVDKINQIKEGIVLHNGIKYSVDINSIGSWNTKIVFFLDTEILFSSAGYNGDIHKQQFDDFISLVQEINLSRTKSGKPSLVSLKYFNEVKNEIDSYFLKAENIVTGSEVIDPSKTAMCSIMNNSPEESHLFAI